MVEGFKQKEIPMSSLGAISIPGFGGRKRQKSDKLLTATWVFEADAAAAKNAETRRSAERMSSKWKRRQGNRWETERVFKTRASGTSTGFFSFSRTFVHSCFFFRMQVFFLEAVAAMATDKGCTLPNILHSVIVYCFFDFPEPLDLIFHGCRAAPFSVKWHSTSSGKGNSDLQWDV